MPVHLASPNAEAEAAGEVVDLEEEAVAAVDSEEALALAEAVDSEAVQAAEPSEAAQALEAVQATAPASEAVQASDMVE